MTSQPGVLVLAATPIGRVADAPPRLADELATADVVAAGQAFVQNLRRGHYGPATEVPPALRLATAFTGLALAM